MQKQWSPSWIVLLWEQWKEQTLMIWWWPRLRKKHISQSRNLWFWLKHDLWTYMWLTAQQENPILKTVIDWISGQKLQDLKHLLGDTADIEEGTIILWEQKKLLLYQGALYYCDTPTGKLEEVLQFIVPKANQVAAMNGCHRDVGHQGQQ